MKGKTTKEEREQLAKELAAVVELLAYSPHAAEVDRIVEARRRRLAQELLEL